ncbi:MAG: trypsin-like serine protease, partial [Microcoleaceae cyanobacterium]
SLLSTGKHILTAAHCLTDTKAENIKVTFHLPDGDVNISAKAIFMHPQYVKGTEFNDIAILELAELAPDNIPRYDIYRGNKEVGQVHLKAGYGLTGQGKIIDDLSYRIKRAGYNVYDSLLNPNQFSNQGKVEEIFGKDIPPNTQLAHDFDNGKPENDAFGEIFGKVDLGLGKNEVNSAEGDSGGPTFINNKIVGVTSYGVGADYFVTTDIDDNANSSYGEFSVDTRVAAYTRWIDKIVTGKKPTNDSLANAIKLTGDSLQIKSNNILATQEGLDPTINGYKLKNTVWWKWQAPRNMSVNLNTFGTNFNTLLGVYTKNAQGLNFVKFSNDAYDRKQSQVIFNAQAGKTYYFVVDGLLESNQGDITLNLKEGSQPYLPKSHDFFVKATVLKGQYIEATGNNALATAERRDPKMFGNPPLQTVWWKWQAPR